MSGVGIPTRDLKMVLGTVKAVLENPELGNRLLELCVRNERALESIRDEQHQLACQKSEHQQYLSRAGRAHDAELKAQRDAWTRELSEQRKSIERDMNEAERLKERLERLRIEVEQQLPSPSEIEQPQAAA
jgi:hypothetical protein